MQNFYKPKGKFNFLGTLVIAISVAIVGSLLSFIYLIINEISPLAILCIFCALGFGVALGFVSVLLIKVFKIRNPLCAVIGLIIGCLIFSYFKWGLYVSRDFNSLYEEYKKYSPSDLADFSFFLDDNNELYSNSDIEEMADTLMSVTARQYIDIFYDGGASAYVADYGKELDMTLNDLESQSFYEFLYLDKVLDEDDIAGSLKAALKSDNFYDHYINNLERDEAALGSILTNPVKLWNDIKAINKEGRWSITSSSSSYSSSINNERQNIVKGIPLWIVWIGELFVICFIAIYIGYNKASSPFIESENKWALKYKNKFMLDAPMNYKAFKNELVVNSAAINNLPPIIVSKENIPFIEVELLHSSIYDENYINVSYRVISKKRNGSKTVSLAKYLKVDKAILYGLFTQANYDVPFSYTPNPATDGLMNNTQNAYGLTSENYAASPESYEEYKKSASYQEQNSSSQTNNTQSTADNNDMPTVDTSMLDQSSTPTMAELAKEERSSEDVYNELNS